MELIVILFFFLVTPFFLTIINVINIFKKKVIKPVLVDLLTIIPGFLLSIILFNNWNAKDYNEAVIITVSSFIFHTPIASWHVPTILFLCSISLLGYFILRFFANVLSPIITAICISSIYMGCILSIAFIIQIAKNFTLNQFIIYITLFPLNFILCSIRLLRKTIKEKIELINQEEHVYKNFLLNRCKKILSHTISWVIIPYILILPLLGISIIILILFGQKPDAFIKAFTETADWTFSQKIPPPNIYPDSHYLCTVALRGDESVVKPTRLGIRKGKKIVVNRQLCIANAFEQCVQERLPRIHKLIRSIYDKYGYPLSKHVTTKKRANFIYRLMKPLEWLFIIFLYTVDKKPENRIFLQYTNFHQSQQ